MSYLNEILQSPWFHSLELGMGGLLGSYVLPFAGGMFVAALVVMVSRK